MAERTRLGAQTSDCCSFGFFARPDSPGLDYGGAPRRPGRPVYLSTGLLRPISSSSPGGTPPAFPVPKGQREGSSPWKPCPHGTGRPGSAPGSWARVEEARTQKGQLRTANGERGTEVIRDHVQCQHQKGHGQWGPMKGLATLG